MTERFGRYELITRIGQGGMAEVYLAKASMAEGLYKLLALKKIHSAFSDNVQFASMFVEEAKVAAGLNHQNIVQVFDFGRLDDTYYLVMEYVDGLDLGQVLRKLRHDETTISPGLAAYIVQRVAAGLDYAHRKKDPRGRPLDIVHRDISPQNILVSFDGAVKITDFGIARVRGHQEEEGVVKGKFAYMAPEQAMGQSVDQRADVYSAGAVLYELLAGKSPFGHLKGKEVLDAVRHSEIPSLLDRAPDVPEELARIVTLALARNPDQRYQSAKELQAELVRFLFSHHNVSGEIVDSEALANFMDSLFPDHLSIETRVQQDKPPPEILPAQASIVASHGEDLRDTSVVMEKKKVVIARVLYRGIEEISLSSARRRDRFLRLMRQRAEDTAYRLEVILDSTDQDGLTFVVGLPESGEQDASRSVALARTLLEVAEQLRTDIDIPVRLSVGLVRGQADVKRSSKFGFKYRLTALLTKAATALASKAAPTSILVGGGVYSAARLDWEFEPAGSLELSSSSRPLSEPGGTSGHTLETYRLLRPRPRREEPSGAMNLAAFGRDIQLRELQHAYRDAVVGSRTRVVAIEGEAGVGKRGLVEYFTKHIEPPATKVLWATARQWDQNMPFALMSDLVQDILGLEEGLRDPTVVGPRIQEMLNSLWPDGGRDIADHRRVLTLLVQGPDAVDKELPDDPKLRQRMVGRTLHQILARMARSGPVVVVLGEFQWADAGSRQLFSRFLDRLPDRPLLILLTTRPDQDNELLQRSEVDIIRLEELGPTEARALVESQFADPKAAAPLIDKVLAKGAGNPYFLRAILDDLVERGTCRREGSQRDARLVWTRKDGAIQIPATVEAVISARLDRLDTQLRSVLRKASVLGRTFTKSELAQLAGREVGEELDELIRRGLLEHTEGDEYHFARQVVLDVAHNGLTAAEARLLHKAAADMLEKRPAGPGRSAKIAQHLLQAKQLSEAAEAFTRAGFESKHLYLYREAYQHFTAALRCGNLDRNQEFEIHLALESILSTWARRNEQIDQLRILDSLARNALERTKVAIRWMAYHRAVSQPKKVIDVYTAARSQAEEAGDPELLAEFLVYLSRALIETGEYTKALQAVAEARSQASSGGQATKTWGDLFWAEGNAFFYLGEYGKAAGAYKKSIDVFRALGRRLEEAVILNNLGFMYYAVGEFVEAINYLKKSYEIYREVGDKSSIASTLSNLGQVYAAVGQQEKGLTYLKKAQSLCRTNQDASFEADAAISIGQVHLARNETAEALEAIEHGLKLAEGAESTYDVVRAKIYYALALSQLGPRFDPTKAYEQAMEAVTASRKARMPQGEVFALSAAAQAKAATGDMEGAVGLSAQAVARLTTASHVAESEVIHFNHAKLLIQASRRDEALPYLEKAFQAVLIKARKIPDKQLRQSYLSVSPVCDIVETYKKQFPGQA